MSPKSDPYGGYRPHWIYLVGLLVLGAASFLGMARLLPPQFVIILHVVVIGIGLMMWAYGRT